jgi:hypothetical protein
VAIAEALKAKNSRWIANQRLDLLKMLVSALPPSQILVSDCIKRAIDVKNQEILNYLFSLQLG